MKQFYKRCLALGLCLVLFCVSLPLALADSALPQVTITVAENYDYAWQVLALVNEERAKTGLPALTMTADLTETAMLRAAESVIYWDHKRPNGNSCFTAFPPYSKAGENMAVGQKNAAAVMLSWMNSDGHRKNIMSGDFGSIGIGCVNMNGIYYWMQVFTNYRGSSMAQDSSVASKSRSIQVLSENLKLTSPAAQAAPTLVIGSSMQISPVVHDTGVSWRTNIPLIADFRYVSSNSTIASVSDGIISAKAVGNATVQVYLDSYSASPIVSYNVTVRYPVPVTGISLYVANKTINRGSSAQLTATVSPENASHKAFSWKSSNPAIATVSATGLVTALAKGDCTISAVTADGAKVAGCTVTVKVPVSAAALSKSSATLVKGKTLQLGATISPADASDKAVSWSSSNTGIATVSSAGLVTAVGKGSCTISAKTRDGAKIASCAVTVTIPVVSVKLSKTAATVIKEKTLQLTATVSPGDATNKAVSWTSSNTKVATVTAAGLVKALAKGSCTITAKTKDGAKLATCKVTVTIPVTAVKLNKTSASVIKGKTLQLTAAVSPSDASNKAVIWSSSNSKVATVGSTGLVKAVGKGSCAITVKTKDGAKLASCKVTVTIPVTAVKLNKTSATLTKGKTVRLAATITPSTASNKTVSWTSSNTKVATVSSTGLVKALGKGSCTITVKTKDGAKVANCKIIVT